MAVQAGGSSGKGGSGVMVFQETIRQWYGVRELKGYAKEEINFVKELFGSLPQTVEMFWREAADTEAIHRVDDCWIRPGNFGRRGWLRDSDYLILLVENQACCKAGIRRSDLKEADPPVYVIREQEATLCAGTVSEFLQAALVYEAVFQLPCHRDDYLLWFTEEELALVRSGLEKRPFEFRGWNGGDVSFYGNACDNVVAIMGDGVVSYGAASQEGYEKLLKVMKGLGEPMA